MKTPLPASTFQTMISRWARIISLPNEHALEAWPPLESPAFRLRQLLHDSDLLDQLFPGKTPLLVEVNAQEQEKFSFEELEKQVGLSLPHAEDIPFALESWLKKYDTLLVLFLFGFDKTLQGKNQQLFKTLEYLSEKYATLTIILFTSLNPSQTPFFSLPRVHNVFGNIFYQPLYSYEDSLHFLKHKEYEWHMDIADKLNEKIAEHFQGHLLLLKTAVRLLRDNPTFSFDDILYSPIMQRRALAIFESLSIDDQKIIVDVLEEKSQQPSEYLKQIKLLVDGKVQIPYFASLKPYLRKSLETINQSSLSTIEKTFTSIERELFDLLAQNQEVVSREIIANKIWGDSWEEKYSDWAIDQTIHRMREKLKKSNAPYEIVTKKGEGFYLKNK